MFLAGDAAHVHSPVGARGMNLGIEDGTILARKTGGGRARDLFGRAAPGRRARDPADPRADAPGHGPQPARRLAARPAVRAADRPGRRRCSGPSPAGAGPRLTARRQRLDHGGRLANGQRGADMVADGASSARQDAPASAASAGDPARWSSCSGRGQPRTPRVTPRSARSASWPDRRQVTRQGETQARPLALGAEVFEGDRIRTAADAKLRLAAGGRLGAHARRGDRPRASSRFHYAPEQAARNVLLEVPRGIIRVLVELLVAHSAFEVQTKTAVASVRGTDWIAEAMPDATAIVALAGRGRGAQRPGGDRRRGRARARVTARPSRPGSRRRRPAPWGEARKSSFIERTALP